MATDAPKTCPQCKSLMAESIAGVLCPACMLDQGWMTEENSPAADLISLHAFGDYERSGGGVGSMFFV